MFVYTMLFACVLSCAFHLSYSKTVLLIYSISFSSKTNASGDGSKPSNLKTDLAIAVDTKGKKEGDSDSGITKELIIMNGNC